MGTTPLPGESEDVSAGPAGPGRCTQGARQPLTLRTRRRVSLDTRGAEESPPGAWASCKTASPLGHTLRKSCGLVSTLSAPCRGRHPPVWAERGSLRPHGPVPCRHHLL